MSGLSGRYIRKKTWADGAGASSYSSSSSSYSSSSSGFGSGTGVDSISIGGSDNRFVVGEIVDAIDPDSKVRDRQPPHPVVILTLSRPRHRSRLRQHVFLRLPIPQLLLCWPCIELPCLAPYHETLILLALQSSPYLWH